MVDEAQFRKMAEMISSMRKTAEGLHGMADTFPAVKRNTARMLASLKMLEINVCDLDELRVEG